MSSQTPSTPRAGRCPFGVLAWLILAGFAIGGPAAYACLSTDSSGAALHPAVSPEEILSVADEVRLARRFELGEGVPQDLVQAAYWFRRAADHGDPDAQNELGYLYFWGRGVERNPEQAAQWFIRAVGGGSQQAKLNLAVLHLGGVGVARDPEFGRDLLLQLADKRVAQAELYLGIVYFQGLGVAPDREAAEQWLRKAARHKSPAAEFALGTLYSSTPGHDHDLKKAADFLRRSARADYAPAMHALGMLLLEHPELNQKPNGEGLSLILHSAEAGFWRASAALGILARDGRGGPPNLGKALRWFTIALRQGGEQAERLLKSDLSTCRGKLTADEQTRSTIDAEAWLSSHPSANATPAFNSISALPLGEPAPPE